MTSSDVIGMDDHEGDSVLERFVWGRGRRTKPSEGQREEREQELHSSAIAWMQQKTEAVRPAVSPGTAVVAPFVVACLFWRNSHLGFEDEHQLGT